MKEEKLSEVMGGIDEAFVLEAAGGDGGAAPQRKRRRFRPAAAAASEADEAGVPSFGAGGFVQV